MRTALKCLLLLMTFNLYAATVTEWYVKTDNDQVKLKVDFFMTSTCPHCHKADAFLKQLEKNVDWLIVNRYVINKDKSALALFNQKLREFHASDFRVPSILFCHSRWVGFDTAQTTGEQLLKGLSYCHQQIKKEGHLTSLTKEVLNRWSLSPFQLSKTAAEYSAFSIITSTAFFDAFNPCSVFAFILFLGFLFVYPARREKIIVGILMIVAFGIAHYLQQAKIEAYYQLLIWIRWLVILLGAGLVIFSVLSLRKIQLTITGYFLAFLSAIAVFAYQQTCSRLNFSLFFQQWLDVEKVQPSLAAFYQLSYQLIYLVPLIALWLAALYFFSGQRGRFYQPYLTFIGQLYLFAIGLILIAYPLFLSELMWSVLLIVLLTFIGWFAIWQKYRTR
ncbi:hypothetical protein E3983_09315 [Legionella israelensis]|uniref:Thioredoxin domain-containing protein n=1 Tax=Legionella israelensis TaxID=454 RepID=A0AAX1EHP0_9GAMM|nr:hypothetical protein [Legionella israelensis]QBR84544.1 hypothetical protein E3983_09315 [Legionella israelensis]